MEGYDFQIVGEDFPDWKCPICLLLLRQAILLPCSHSACKTCLMKWEEEGDSGVFRCPSCQTIYQREKVHAGTEGRFIDRFITTSLKVKCKEHIKRCDWVGTISDYKIHEKSCQYASVPCCFTGCDVEVQRQDVSLHHNECNFRIIKCKFCMGDFSFDQLDNHLRICDYLDITCLQLGCGKFLKRKDLPSHIANDCQYVEVACPFEGMGCTHKVLRRDLDDHLNNSSQQHTNVLLHFTLKLTKEVNGLKEANTELRIEMEEFKQSSTLRICGLEEKLEQKENEINAVNRKVDDIKKQLHQKTDNISKDVKVFSTKINQLENTLSKNEKKSEEDLSTNKKFENIQAVTNIEFAAVMSLSSEERSKKKWTFKELSKLIENKENEKIVTIISLKPALAVFRNHQLSSLLHHACRYNNTACIDVLIKNGCSVNHENSLGSTPIHLAAVYGCVDAAKILLSIDGTLVNSANSSNKKTPLHYAAQHNNQEFVKYILLQPGIQVNLKDCWNEMADQYNTSQQIRQMIKEHRQNKFK